MKRKLRELGFLMMLGIICIGLVIFYVGLGGRGLPTNFYFIGIGLLILTPFAVYLVYDYYKSAQEERQKKRTWRHFKETAEKIDVDLTDLIIKSNSWNEVIVTDNSSYAGFNELSGNGHRNIRSITKNLNQVSFKIPHQGQIINYTASIPIDTTKLEMYFAIQKSTILYLDPSDKSKMYLDLEFIN